MATTPVFLPGKFRGLRSLARYNPWGCKESDTTEQLTHTQRKVCFLRMEKTTILITGCPKSEKRKRLRLLRKVGWSLVMLEPHAKAHERQ